MYVAFCGDVNSIFVNHIKFVAEFPNKLIELVLYTLTVHQTFSNQLIIFSEVIAL